MAHYLAVKYKTHGIKVTVQYGANNEHWYQPFESLITNCLHNGQLPEKWPRILKN